MRLRPYQRDAILAAYGAWGRGALRPALVLATGLGKTVIFAHIIAQYLAQNPGQKVLVLVHRDELATQARAKIMDVAPGLRVGIVKAGVNEVDADVIIGSVQTLARPARRDALRGVGLGIVDEAHHAAARTYREIMSHYGAWDGVKWLGVTATMHREDAKGLGEVWEEVSFTRDIVWGVNHRYDPVTDLDVRIEPGEIGYLVRPRGLRIRIPQLHLEDKRLIVAGEYSGNKTGAAMINADTGPAIARAVQEYGKGLRLVTFAPSIESAEHFAEWLHPHGGAELVTGKTPKHQRLASYARFESGHTMHLVNAMVLTEGWDAPWCDGVIIARPTKNPGLFQQMVGRALRTHPGKTEALIIDVAGATELGTLSSLADLGMDPPEQIGERPEKPDLDEDALLDEGFDPYFIPMDAPAPVDRVHAEEVDFFGRPTKFHWLRTRNSVPFLTIGRDLVFVWDHVTGHSVGFVNLDRAETATMVQSNMPEPEAMIVAEKVAEELGYSASKAGRHRPAGYSMIRKLARFGVAAPESATTGQVQDLIDIATAERKLGIV